MSKLSIGIDLGTTFSLAAVLHDGNPVVLRNSLGELLTPSVVSLSATGEILVGAPAKARETTHPQATASVFKRAMGTDTQYDLDGKSFRPEQLSALVLKSLKEDVEAALGCAVDEAVVTVPAYFGELQRRATLDACEIAGLHVERIINEPTAAALAFGLHERERELRAIVLDLGGGTFDVTVLEIIEGVIEIQASAGDSRLGGEDFCDELVALCRRRIESNLDADVSSRVGLARLREACERTKRALSTKDAAELAVADLPLDGGRMCDFTTVISRLEAEEAWQALLGRIEAPIRRALRDAKTTPESIDEVLFVGGATRMSCIAALATRIFGKLPRRDLPPDEAVALGAAVQAALKAGDAAVDDMVVTDIAPFTLGVAAADTAAGRVIKDLLLPVIERGTVLPASRVERVRTIADHQTKIVIEVYQGEHAHCSKNQKLGEYKITGIPRGPAGEEEIDVRFTYDLAGILDVDCTIVSTGQTRSLVIERSRGRLSKSQVEEAHKAMQRLKFHPRDALPNVTALNRAEALHVELRGDARSMLTTAIGQFHGALESQDPKTIEQARGNLLRLVEELRAPGS